MARLPDNEPDLQGLEGWGSIKKKLGINKLGTRSAIKSSFSVAKAIVMPSKKTATNAAVDLAKSKIGSTVLRIGANVVAPGSGEIIEGATQAVAMKQEAKAADATAQAQLRTLEAETAALQKQADERAAATAAAPAPTGRARKLLLGSSLALLLVGVTAKVVKGRKKNGSPA